MGSSFKSKPRPTAKPFGGTRIKMTPPPSDDPVQSLQAMDQAVANTPPEDECGPPILPCKKPWLELTLFDRDESPVPNAPYTLSLPSGESRSGTLDENGFIHIDNIDADASKLTAEVKVHLDDNGDVSSYEVKVVGIEEMKATPPEDEDGSEAQSAERAEFLIA